MTGGLAVGVAALLAGGLGLTAQAETPADPEPPRELSAASHLTEESAVVVETESGALRGTNEYGYLTWEGVPFAAPPVGDLRFQPPQPVQAWDGVRDATQPGQVCTQLSRGAAPAPVGGEDCLYLNVTAPATDSRRKLPVMVWIHGGSFVFGAGSTYDASRLATLGDVIVVTVNYRLGPLGFLAHPALSAEQGDGAPANLALADQQAALRWVQENIAAFGGDERRVTIFGESAGAASVCANLVSPGSAGLFSRAIAQSYSCAADFAARPAAEAAGSAFAAGVECADPRAAAACLRRLSAEELVQAWPGGAFTVGGPSLPLQPGEAIERGRYHRVPLIHGNTRDENRLFTPLAVGTDIDAAEYAATVRRLFPEAADDVLARYPADAFDEPIYALTTVTTDAAGPLSTCAHVLAYDLVSSGGRKAPPVYAYQFRDRTAPPYVDFGPEFEEGAQHATELPYLFPRLFGAPLTAEQERLSRAMVTYWTTFARTGDPNGRAMPVWPRYHHAHDVLGLALPEQGGLAPVDVAAESTCAFWDEVIDLTASPRL